MEAKTFPSIAMKNGFTFLNGKLQEIEIKSQTIFRNEYGDWKISLVASTGDGEIEISPGEFYESGIAYTNGDKPSYYRDSFLVLGVNEDGTFYTNENGQVKENILNPIHITVFDKNDRLEFSCPEIENLLAKNVRIYHSRNVAEQMCECTVRNLDGKESPMTGILRKIMLTDEQRKAVSEFVEAFEKAKNLGVRFAWDDSHGKMYVVNTQNVEVESYYQGYVEDGMIIPEIFERDVEKDFTIPVNFDYLGEEYVLRVITE